MQKSTDKFSPDVCHDNLYKSIKPELAYSEHGKEEGYKQRLRAKLLELLGDFPEKVPLDVRFVSDKKEKDYRIIRLEFCTEKGTCVPAYLTIPHVDKKPPVVICVQGHSSGMHLSIGKAKSLKDYLKIKKGNRDFAKIAAKNGYAALVIEQRGFGERLSRIVPDYSMRCIYASQNALLLGRTLLGERVFDIMRAVDLCKTLGDYVDAEKIACMGNSGGGTATFYAAALDERISIAMPSCSVCTYEDSIGRAYHCPCNYLPSARKYFDMGDVGTLISPRKLLIVAGKKDNLFPSEGVNEAFATIKKGYEDDGVGQNARLFWGDGGHRFYGDAYKEFNEFAKELNWR